MKKPWEHAPEYSLRGSIVEVDHLVNKSTKIMNRAKDKPISINVSTN